jgi:hypothetical protein
MRPPRNSWLDSGASIVAALRDVPDASVRIAEQGVLIDGTLTPVLLQWDTDTRVRDHVRSWLLASAPRPPAQTETASGDMVIAYYHRERDAAWLPLFLSSLQCVNDSVSVHCVGDFDPNEQALLARHRCIAHRAPATGVAIIENVAHFYLSQVLDRLAPEGADASNQVLMLDSVRAVFPRDPFLRTTIGLSVFCEGPTRIGESDYNRARLAYFVMPDERRLQYPTLSSALLRGSVPVVREFYRHLLAELVGRTELMKIHKVIQGAFNKLCRDSTLGFPVIAHPNGAEAYFDHWPSGLAIDIRHGVRVGGTVPGVVLGDHTETALMMKLRVDLNLPTQ